ncbi:ras-related protein Rab-31-like [Coregonus clupeaformis]|uniref:ras-related protein Rab-31-like n=1 Tax=Coregonus clupeaformis TaxID=59861 RepID=UPI001BE0824B|nr:ras-related protein Rab-31-like [Coregonus clupeaformis]
MAIRELKVCLLGDTGVGKSSIVCRFVQDHFDHNVSPTIGASFLTKTVPCGHELHKFLIWDTAGQERPYFLVPMVSVQSLLKWLFLTVSVYYRGSAAAVIVYDITKLGRNASIFCDSFQTLKKWVKELKEHGPEDIIVALAGNKKDLGDIREVPMKEAKDFAESIAAIFMETSARNAVNVEELFQKISKQIPPLENPDVDSNESFKITRQPPPSNQLCC